MRIGIMQPYLFPYIGYFQLIHAVDRFVLLDDVSYINKGWTNRNRILVNGESAFFTVPLQKASQNRKINEIVISPDHQWKNKLLKTLSHSYRNAPYFDAAYSLVEQVLSTEEEVISRLVFKSLKLLSSFLDIQTEIVPTSTRYDNQHLRAQAKIIDICRQEKASVYINPENGAGLYDADMFRKQEIELRFLKAELAPYPQFKNSFVAGLSIIDVLMFNPKEKIKQFVGAYDLVEKENGKVLQPDI